MAYELADFCADAHRALTSQPLLPALDDIAARQIEAFDACQAASFAGCHVDLSASSLLTTPVMAAGFVLGLLALLPVALRALRVHRRL